MNKNMEAVTYIGGRAGVAMDWNRRRYVFKQGARILVPDEFARRLLDTHQFARSDQLDRPLESNHPKGGTLLVRRSGALGDLIMFRAAVAAFQRATGGRYRLVLRCHPQYVPMFEHDPLWAGVTHQTRSAECQYDGMVSFDQVAEADHRGVEEHRATLFLRAMTTESITIRPEDWHLPIPAEITAWVRRHLEVRGLAPDRRRKPLVALQLRGSGLMKSLPPALMQQLVRRLLALEVSLILLEHDDRTARLYEVSDDVHTMTQRDALHGIELLKHVDLAITMDSGPLWMAHAAACPVLAVLGPTRPEQRIAFHPLYPRGARAVCLNDLIKCPACFEAAKACHGRYDCLQKQPDELLALRTIVDAAEDMLTSRVSLPQVESV